MPLAFSEKKFHKGDPMITSLTKNQTGFQKTALKEFMRGIVQMTIFCQQCKTILDMKTVGHIEATVEHKKVGGKVLCPKCFQQAINKAQGLIDFYPQKQIQLEVMNARELYTKS